MVDETQDRSGWPRAVSLIGPRWAVLGAVLFGLLALALGAVAAYAFTQPTEVRGFEERLRYEHRATFDYRAEEEPSAVPTDGIVVRVLPVPSDGPQWVPGLAISTNRARNTDLGFTYSLASSLPVHVSGETSASLEIRGGEVWATSWPLMEPVEFSGPTASARLDVDLPRIAAFIGTMEKESGFASEAYTVTVTPSVHLSGQIGGEAIDDTFAPPFVMQFTRTATIGDPDLHRSEMRRLGEEQVRPQAMRAFGLSATMTDMRRIGLLGAVGCLAATAVLAGYILLRLGSDEEAFIAARYGAMLVAVAGTRTRTGVPRVKVGSVHDLARLAERDGRIIFHEKMGQDEHIYFLPEGNITYEYTSGGKN